MIIKWSVELNTKDRHPYFLQVERHPDKKFIGRHDFRSFNHLSQFLDQLILDGVRMEVDEEASTPTAEEGSQS